MEISYSPTIEDFREALSTVDRAYPGVPDAPAPAWQNFLFRGLRRLLETVAIWICVGFLLLLSITNVEIHIWHLILVAVSAFAGGASACWAVQDKTAMQCIRGHVERRGLTTIRLGNDGVEVQRGATRSFTLWGAYSRVAIVNNHLFLFQDCAADYIPLGAFENEEQMNEFGKFAAAKITEHSARQE